MRPVRDLFGELVERRLWPIALVLVLALVAVPVLLAKSPPAATDDGAPASGAAPLAAAASAPDVPAEPIVTVADGKAPSAPLRGRAKDPFRQQHVPPDPGDNPPVSSTASDAGTGGSGGTGGGGSGGTTAPPPVRTLMIASIDVRLGHAGRRLRLIEDVPPLAPLPRAQKPVVIFLGILRRDPQTTAFLVSTDVRVQGPARSACLPSRKLCQAILLRRGDVVFLDYTEPDGTVVQYELALESLDFREATSQEEANNVWVTADRIGRRLLRLAEERVARRAARRSARRAQARGAMHATAVTGTTPQAASLTPLP
jgi:hypothetical protein